MKIKLLWPEELAAAVMRSSAQRGLSGDEKKVKIGGIERPTGNGESHLKFSKLCGCGIHV